MSTQAPLFLGDAFFVNTSSHSIDFFSNWTIIEIAQNGSEAVQLQKYRFGHKNTSWSYDVVVTSWELTCVDCGKHIGTTGEIESFFPTAQSHLAEHGKHVTNQSAFECNSQLLEGTIPFYMYHLDGKPVIRVAPAQLAHQANS